MPLHVPSYSQHLNVRDTSWRHRACGVVALATVMDAYRSLPTRSAGKRLSSLIHTGVRIGAYDPQHGWRHAGLVRLARMRGFRARRFDWTDQSPARTMRLLGEQLATGPVIVSIHRNLSPEMPGHLVVITNMTTQIVRYHDPDSVTRAGVTRTVSLARFRKGWKQRGIVVRPRPASLRLKKRLGTL